MRYRAWVVQPVVLTFAGSLLLSLIARLAPLSINNDGVLYLTAAEAFREQGFGAAVEVYGWPFYSMLIAALSGTGLSLLGSAYLITAFAFAVMSSTFVAVVERLYPGERPLHYLAMLVVLLLPELAELRHEVLRDNGYLALVIVSLLFYLQAVRTPSAGRFLLWGAAVLLAALFRIEAAVLGATGALALLAMPERRRLGATLLVTILVGGLLALLLLKNYAPASRVVDLANWWHFYTDEFAASFHAAAERLRAAILNEYSENYARESAVAVVIVLLLGKLLKGLTPVYALLLWLGRGARFGLGGVERAALWGYGVGLALPSLLFALQHFFLTQRYVLGLVLLLLLLVPRALAVSAERLPNRATRYAVGGALLILFAGATGRKVVGGDDPVLAAGRWLQPYEQSLWTNSSVLGYHADPAFGTRQVTVDWQPGWPQRLPAPGAVDWLALVLDDEEVARLRPELQARGLQLIKLIEGDRKSVSVWSSPAAAPMVPIGSGRG